MGHIALGMTLAKSTFPSLDHGEHTMGKHHSSFPNPLAHLLPVHLSISLLSPMASVLAIACKMLQAPLMQDSLHYGNKAAQASE